MDLRNVTHPCPDPVNMSDKKDVFNEATDLGLINVRISGGVPWAQA